MRVAPKSRIWCVIETTKFDHAFACCKYWNARVYVYIFFAKEFLGACSFTGSLSKRSCKSFQIINSLDQRKSLSSRHIAFWDPTQPNLLFAGFPNKFPPKIICRTLNIKVFAEFGGPKIVPMFTSFHLKKSSDRASEFRDLYLVQG